MAKVFITGSTDGLGKLAAEKLLADGHHVVLHARNASRAGEGFATLKHQQILTADLTILEEIKSLAQQLNSLGPFDAIIHNAGVYQAPKDQILMVNTLAPYILSCLITRPGRLIYLSSGLHHQGDASLKNLIAGSKGVSYSDSKLHVVILAKAIARKWSNTFSNAVNPGWVPTKMGGRGAPDDLEKGAETQCWLAVSNDDKAKVTGRYFFHKQEADHRSETNEVALQEKFLQACADITGISLPT